MRRKIEIDLPKNSGKYEVIQFTSRENENYDSKHDNKQAAEGLAELLGCFNDQIPNEVMEIARKDPRAKYFRDRL